LDSSELIVLRKIKHSESSLVAGGISPDYGRLDFYVKGALKLSRSKFPCLDLFRSVKVSFRMRHEGLLSIHGADHLKSRDGLARSPALYMDACSAAAFALKNSKFMVSRPLVYRCAGRLLDCLQDEAVSPPAPGLPGVSPLLIIKTAFLLEDGLAPEDFGLGAGTARFIEELPSFSEDDRTPRPEVFDGMSAFAAALDRILARSGFSL
jgi:hypothetical protein